MGEYGEEMRVWMEKMSVLVNFECAASGCECVEVGCAVLSMTVPYLGNPHPDPTPTPQILAILALYAVAWGCALCSRSCSVI